MMNKQIVNHNRYKLHYKVIPTLVILFVNVQHVELKCGIKKDVKNPKKLHLQYFNYVAVM
ncbi:hypothetical protein A2U01_0063776, partial [Trifolium medium]|nr:hypothetical protein [Trifolium medium]